MTDRTKNRTNHEPSLDRVKTDQGRKLTLCRQSRFGTAAQSSPLCYNALGRRTGMSSRDGIPMLTSELAANLMLGAAVVFIIVLARGYQVALP